MVRGGAKLSWKPMGTVWARNLTANRETGLGAWTDAEIARAIRSGIAKDGRALHWQAMIWDHASNWDEEDVRAMIAFLRVLPPMRRVIPHRDRRPPTTVRSIRSGSPQARRPGAGDDCLSDRSSQRH